MSAAVASFPLKIVAKPSEQASILRNFLRAAVHFGDTKPQQLESPLRRHKPVARGFGCVNTKA